MDVPEAERKQGANLTDFVRFGRYTVFLMVLYELQILPMMGSLTFMVYGGLAPHVVACGNVSFAEMGAAEGCSLLSTLREAGLCRQPQLSAQFNSVAFEFGYACEHILAVKQSTSLQMIGVMVGSVLFGQLSDWFGRKRMILIANAGICLFGLSASSLAQSLAQFTALQFVAMIFTGGHSTCIFVFLIENIPKKHRVLTMAALSYSPNYILFALIAYLCGEWRSLLRVAALLNVPALLLLLLAFESPRWLIHKARLDEAMQVLAKMERFNGTMTADREAAIAEIVSGEARSNWTSEGHIGGRKCNYLHLFYTCQMAVHTSVLAYAFLSISIVAFAVLFNMGSLSGSIYLNMAMFGAFRYAINLFVGGVDYFSPRTGRRPIYASNVAVILASLFAVFAFKVLGWREQLLVRVALIVTGALCSQLFLVSHLATTELYATPVRNSATSFVQVFNIAGIVIAPHLFYLAFYWDALPFLVMLSLLSLNLCLFLAFIPETKGNILKDSMPPRSEMIFYKFTKEAKRNRNPLEAAQEELLHGK